MKKYILIFGFLFLCKIQFAQTGVVPEQETKEVTVLRQRNPNSEEVSITDKSKITSEKYLNPYYKNDLFETTDSNIIVTTERKENPQK